MNASPFPLPPEHFGLPTRQQLVDLRIWDGHYHALNGTDNLRQHHAMMAYVERLGIERVISLDAAGTRFDAFAETPFDAERRALLLRDQARISGIIRIDPSDPEASCAKMEKWIRHGPCIGIKYSGDATNRDGIVCSHPNNDPILRLATELGAVVFVHTWLKVGGTPRRVGGGNNQADSTPADVVALARRFPHTPIICGHSGGDWEIGVGIVRPQRNVLFEFSGSDPHSGAVDLAVKELGADRLVWGGHGPSRSFATELSKVLDADLTQRDRMQVLGANYRRIAADIFRRKGWRIDV